MLKRIKEDRGSFATSELKKLTPTDGTQEEAHPFSNVRNLIYDPQQHLKEKDCRLFTKSDLDFVDEPSDTTKSTYPKTALLFSTAIGVAVSQCL